MEDLFYTILGFVMIYTWVHSVVIIAKKVKDLTSYEGTVMIFALVGFILMVIGTMI